MKIGICKEHFKYQYYIYYGTNFFKTIVSI